MHGKPRDQDFSEAYGCISPCFPLKPVGVLLEPGFLDGKIGEAWIPANLATIGESVADGIHAWANR
jgi:hypothetical protein